MTLIALNQAGTAIEGVTIEEQTMSGVNAGYFKKDPPARATRKSK